MRRGKPASVNLLRVESMFVFENVSVSIWFGAATERGMSVSWGMCGEGKSAGKETDERLSLQTNTLLFQMRNRRLCSTQRVWEGSPREEFMRNSSVRSVRTDSRTQVLPHEELAQRSGALREMCYALTPIFTAPNNRSTER
ncbi:hypothetical protein DNTS_008237 [Danionella cerebrum]|uniref:Uncharacterized protein n=1 Tax=Danionella cerebrum TaxID=2873325 RepID=A0A553NGJ4_9TELE|nr:hypothetical protein DNTS_008237 [Danionella translucida]